MEGIFYLSGKNYKLNFFKLLGGFLLVIAILGLFVSISDMYQDWYAYMDLVNCYNRSTELTCHQYIYDETGITIPPGLYLTSPQQNVIIILKPLIYVLGWIILGLFALLLNGLGHHAVRLNVPELIEHKAKSIKK